MGKRAFVQIDGVHGWVDSKRYPWTSIDTSPTTGVVTWNLPDAEFPNNTEYWVCVSTNELTAYLTHNCYNGMHSTGNEAISVSLE